MSTIHYHTLTISSQRAPRTQSCAANVIAKDLCEPGVLCVEVVEG
jgi:hypothetical protein